VTPIILVSSGPAFQREGTLIEPKAELAFCEVCGEPAPWGYVINGERRVYCSRHRPEIQQRNTAA